MPLPSDVEEGESVTVDCVINVFLGDSPANRYGVKAEGHVVSYGSGVPNGFEVTRVAKWKGRSNRQGQIYREFELEFSSGGLAARDTNHFFRLDGQLRGDPPVSDAGIICTYDVGFRLQSSPQRRAGSTGSGSP